MPTSSESPAFIIHNASPRKESDSNQLDYCRCPVCVRPRKDETPATTPAAIIQETTEKRREDTLSVPQRERATVPPTRTATIHDSSISKKRDSNVPDRCICSTCTRMRRDAGTVPAHIATIPQVFTRRKRDCNKSLSPHNCECSVCIRLRKGTRTAQEGPEERNKYQIPETDVARRAWMFAKDAVYEALQVDMTAEKADEPLQQVMFGFAVATFGAGLAIRQIVTAFESCRVRVKSLPLDAKYSEVCELFTQQGVEPWRFHVVEMNETPDGKQEADVICQDDLKIIAIGLEGIEFRQERLLFEVYQNSGIKGMRSSAANHSDFLTIIWRTPCKFVAIYADERYAEDKVRELDGKVCAGTRATVKMANPQTSSFGHAAIICGLPSSTTDRVVAQFSGSFLVRRLRPTEHDIVSNRNYVRYRVEKAAEGGLKSFETIIEGTDGLFMARAYFHSMPQAKAVYKSLQQHFSYLGNNRLSLYLSSQPHYVVSIPSQQYRAQKARWDLLEQTRKDGDGCSMWIEARAETKVIYIVGIDKKAVGSLKVRAENLAAGEKLEYWHQSLGVGTDSQRFLDSVFDATGAYIQYDRQHLVLRAYGETENVDKARAMIESELERLHSLQTTCDKEESVRFLLKRGLAALAEDLDRDNTGRERCTLDILSACQIAIQNGNSRNSLSMLIIESLDHFNPKNERCPICLDEITSPVQLPCGHNYCAKCIQHFLATASETGTRVFPLSCMGNNDKCRIPISIAILQKLLSPPKFQRLLETAFVAHMELFPRDFRYCPTPGCSQVYRCNMSSPSSVLHCPSCLGAVCSSCHREAQDGATCNGCTLHIDLTEQEQLNDQLAMKSGFKKCPECRVWIEKMGGCNHVSCRCGAHICWACMRNFPTATIYKHTSRCTANIIARDQLAQMDPLREARLPRPRGAMRRSCIIM